MIHTNLFENIYFNIYLVCIIKSCIFEYQNETDMKTKSIQSVVEVPLSEVISDKFDSNVSKYGEDEDTCIICGKKVKDAHKAKQVQLLTNGNLISTDEDVENSQGFYTIGPDCARKLNIRFAF